METNISSAFYTLAPNSASSSDTEKKQNRSMTVNHACLSTDLGKTVSVSANSYKEFSGDSALTPYSSFNAYTPSYRDPDIGQSITSFDYLGTIIGFYSGGSHFGVSGICRITYSLRSENYRFCIANTSSSAASITVASSSAHFQHYLISNSVQFVDPTTEEIVTISDYLINSTLE